MRARGALPQFMAAGEAAAAMRTGRRRARVPAPLWRLLQAAAEVVAAVRDGQSATAALEQVEAALRPGTQALAFQALRRLGRAEALRRLLARRAAAAGSDALLCTALALCWREAEAPYEVFTLVDQAVEAAKRTAGARAGQLRQCVLRRFLRERDALVAADRRRSGGALEPSALVDRAAEEGPAAHWQASWRPTTGSRR